jgi:AcrR family transcriptional regulator
MSTVNRSTSTRAESRPRRRRRLTVEARREELLRVGAELFGKYGYEDTGIEDVAEAAGASTALLYHYFPSKRLFFLAVAKAESERIAALTAPTPTSFVDGVRRSIDAYLEDVEAHPRGHLTMHRGRSDPEVRTLLERNEARQVRRIVVGVTGRQEAPELLRLAVSAWIGFLQKAVDEWIERPAVEREALGDLLATSLVNTLRAAKKVDPDLPLVNLPD